MAAAEYKVTYFDIPALAEPIRMVFALSGTPFKDECLQFPDWPAIKPTTKWGQVPKMLKGDLEMTQSVAITRYLARTLPVNGKALYPEDPLTGFKIDEIIGVVDDMRLKLVPSFGEKDQAKKEAMRLELVVEGGGMTVIAEKLDKYVGAWCVGEEMTLADLYVFWFLRFLVSGFLDGVPKDCFEKFSKLQAIAKKVGDLPQLKEYYAKKSAHPMYAAFQK